MHSSDQVPLNKIIAAISVVVAGVSLLIMGYYFYLAYNRGASDPDNVLIVEASKNVQTLDMQSASASYAALATSETDPEKRARYVIMQGFTSNNAGNYEAGIPLLKAVVANPAESNQVKAEALITMLQISFKPNSEEALDLIFNDDGIYAEARGDGDISSVVNQKFAIGNLYQVADTYHQYAISQYARAFLEARYLLSHRGMSGVEKQESLTFIEATLNNGDALLSVELNSGFYEKDQVNAVRDMLFMSMHMRLFALEVLARTDETRRDDVEAYYAYTLGVFSYTLNVPAVWSMENYVRFYYAAYLADVYGEEKAGEIHNVMLPLYVVSGEREISNSYSIWPFLESALSSSESHNADAAMIQKIAGIDPTFKAFLEAQGWLHGE